MRYVFFLVFGLAVSYAGICSALVDSYPIRTRLAKEAMELAFVKDMTENINKSMQKQLQFSDKLSPAAQNKIMNAVYFTPEDIKLLKEYTVKVAANMFTADELDAMITFYGSPEGRRVQEKMPDFSQKVKDLAERIVLPRLTQVLEEVEANQQKRPPMPNMTPGMGTNPYR